MPRNRLEPNPESTSNNGVAVFRHTQEPQLVEAFNLEGVEQSTEAPSVRDRFIDAWRSISVKTKVTALAITLGVVPVLVVGGIATYSANEIIVRETLEDRQKLAVNIGIQLSALIQNRLHDAETIASSPIIVRSATREATSAEDLITYFDSFTKRDLSYEQIGVATPDGKFVYLEQNNTPLRTTKTEIPDGLNTPNAKPFEVVNAAYFLQTRGTLRPAAILLQESLISQTPSFFVAAPALDDASQLSSIIYSQTSVESFSELIRENLINLLHKGGSGSVRGLPQYQIVDHSAAYFETTEAGTQQEVAPTRIKAQGNAVTIDGNPVQAGGSVFLKENRVVVSSGEDLGTEMLSIFPKYAALRNTGVATTTIDVSQKDNQEYLLSYAPIARVEGLYLDWGVLIYEPTATVFAPQRMLILTLSVGTLITALLLGAIAAVIANRATRPLIAAAKTVDQIGQGELDARVNVRGRDEIAVLGSNINRMANQIQTYITTQTLESERERLLALAKGSNALRTPDLNTIFKQAVQGTRELFDLDYVMLYQFDADWNGSIISEAIAPDLPRTSNSKLKDFQIPESLLKRLTQRQVVPISDVAAPGFPPVLRKQLEYRTAKSSLLAPLFCGDRLFGVLTAHYAEPHDWQEYEVNFLQQLAIEIGLSLYRVELLETTEKLAEEQRQLKEKLQQRVIRLVQEINPISEGDLTIRAQVTADEIGTIASSYNSTVESLRKIILQVQTAAEQVVASTETNEISVHDLREEAARQAEGIKKALHQIEQLQQVVQNVAFDAQKAEAAVYQAEQVVNEGDAAMDRTVQEIQAIQAVVSETVEKAQHLSESSEQISKVVELINRFAAQTNILSLNSSVEAARAGEYGKGFATIALEVRKLAGQSAQAAQEIRTLITNIQTETREVVTTMAAGSQRVETGTQLVSESRQSLNKITAVSRQINEVVASIVQSTVVQSQMSETVTETMKDIAAIANDTSVEASQVSASFEELRKVAQNLQAEVSQFKV
ncbi:HAMP domain-containing protein [Oculatella sp. LEGE 06141]|uniref:methyl-accepting chemotaxis protein n=1 Tax=Oculatella sp. LEGE 06141 TaxID=1828648 RepID=UPI0018803BFB|nr:methyl-accepting chemotaxis protein [Oculatella sp. LEGE 06141]MBE9178861.1 HAMP domain-containing protein [Oculatella sp. LEGE 06141]